MAESDRFAQEERELSRPKDGWDKVRACGTALVALVIGIGGYIVDSNISKREQT